MQRNDADPLAAVIEVLEYVLVFLRDHKKLQPPDYQRLMGLLDTAKEQTGVRDESAEV